MASILRRSRLSGTLFCQFLMLAHGYRSKFLPYGSQYAPTSAAGSAKRADAAFETAALPEAFLSSLKAAREVEIVASTPTATLIRAPEDVIIRLAAACGARAHPLDAGPFASRDAAAELLHRWITEYWECKRLETGGNSCFEFGGCHKRCWWRGAIGQVVLAELHEELQQPIPREEIEAVFRQVEAIARSTALDLAPGRSPRLQLTGSFRRGASSAHDIDILLVLPDPNPRLDGAALRVAAGEDDDNDDDADRSAVSGGTGRPGEALVPASSFVTAGGRAGGGEATAGCGAVVGSGAVVGRGAAGLALPRMAAVASAASAAAARCSTSTQACSQSARQLPRCGS